MGLVPPSPTSELGKELRKWEQHPTVYSLTEDGDHAPGNPYTFRAYPTMLYRAELVNGKATVIEQEPEYSLIYPNDEAYQRACLAVQAANKRRQKIVSDEAQERIAKGQGWANSPQEALEVCEAQQIAIAQAAAEANHAAQRMSDQAQRELREANEATEHHVVDVQPKKKRGRPAKGIDPVTA